MKKIKGFLGKPLVRGILKEATSYIPVVGDTVSNLVENKLGTGVATVDEKPNQIWINVGRWVFVIVVAYLIGQGYITEEQVDAANEVAK